MGSNLAEVPGTRTSIGGLVLDTLNSYLYCYFPFGNGWYSLSISTVRRHASRSSS